MPDSILDPTEDASERKCVKKNKWHCFSSEWMDIFHLYVWHKKSWLALRSTSPGKKRLSEFPAHWHAIKSVHLKQARVYFFLLLSFQHECLIWSKKKKKKKLKNKQHFPLLNIHCFPPCGSIYLWTPKLTPLTHCLPSLKFNTAEPLWWRLARNEKHIRIFCSIIIFY